LARSKLIAAEVERRAGVTLSATLKKNSAEKKEGRAMINRRTALGIIASASTIGASGATLAKEKHHLNGKALLGDRIKQNGKHKIHTAGKVDVFAEVNNGKVVGASAAGMQVKKVKSRQKLAETSPGLILASMQLAQTDVYYYGYWVYDPVADYYYWFTSDVVIVDASWVDYVP
jgi:hypothetical protein